MRAVFVTFFFKLSKLQKTEKISNPGVSEGGAQVRYLNNNKKNVHNYEKINETQKQMHIPVHKINFFKIEKITKKTRKTTNEQRKNINGKKLKYKKRGQVPSY